MTADQLHEDVIIKILERLPIKSLLRFTTVSKRWRSIILSDHQFAKSQFQIANCDQPSRTRLLLSAAASDPKYESLDSETPLDHDIMSSNSVIKLTCPFKQPDDVVSILCSCDGLVLASRNYCNFFIWNPSTGFSKKLPHYARLSSQDYYGFGYLSATDDYKVILKDVRTDRSMNRLADIFSWRANTWKTIQVPSDHEFFYDGFLLNEALHWRIFKMDYHSSYIFAFDLATEDFRTIHLPTTVKHATTPSSFRGCLCVLDNAYGRNAPGSVDLWVMREYGVADSWDKLFNIRVPIPPTNVTFKPILVTEASTLLRMTLDGENFKLIRSVHHQEENFETYLDSQWYMIMYKESLIWLH